jgi:hypothetical protein
MNPNDAAPPSAGLPRPGAIPSGPRACWACRRPIDAGDPYCRWCGKRQQADDHWYFRPLWIVVMTLTVAGPFTLPLVWRSPSLSRKERWALTAFIVAVTLLVLWVGWILLEFMLTRFEEIGKAAREM